MTASMYRYRLYAAYTYKYTLSLYSVCPATARENWILRPKSKKRHKPVRLCLLIMVGGLQIAQFFLAFAGQVRVIQHRTGTQRHAVQGTFGHMDCNAGLILDQGIQSP